MGSRSVSDKPAPSLSNNEGLRLICENITFGQVYGYYPGNPPVLVAEPRFDEHKDTKH